MCLAIFKPSDQILNKDALAIGYENNPHGAGYAFSKNGKLHVKKGFFDFQAFWMNFNSIQKGNPAMVHFRHANVGEINHKNCHPWRIDENHAMIHNGTLYDFIQDKEPISDSGLYTRLVLKPTFKQFKPLWKTQWGHYFLEKTMGGSKMVILNNLGEHLILREEAGQWEEGCWYSNDGYKEFSNYAGTTLPWQYEFEFEFPAPDPNLAQNESSEEEAEAIHS